MMNSSSDMEQIDLDANYMLGLVGGSIAMLVSAAIWGVVTYLTEYQIGYMAIGVGFLVGIAFRFFGKGHSMVYGLSSAILALIGCVLGNLLFYAGVIAREEGASFIGVVFFLITNPLAVLDIFIAAFDVRDLLFYGIAAYAGFKVALDHPQQKK